MNVRPDLREIVARRHMPVLDGLRAVAVFLVVCGHAGYPVAGIPGDLGVSLFFVLSGFLITRLLLREERDTGTVSLRNFYVRRTLRIFPAYYAFLAFSLAADRLLSTDWSRGLLASAFGYGMNYYNAFNGHPHTSVAHAWSLAVEEQFYLLWPLAFLFASRRGKRTAIRLLVVATAAVMTWRSWLYLGANVGSAYVYNAFDTRFDNLAIGCILALIIDHERVRTFGVVLAKRAWYPLVTLVLLFLSHERPSAYHFSIGFTIDAILIAVLIVQLLQLFASAGWKWLENPVIRYLGTISYPIYLYHAWGAGVGRRVPMHDNPTVNFVASVAATILLASGSYFVVERPFLRLKERFASDRKALSRRSVGADIAQLPASDRTVTVQS